MDTTWLIDHAELMQRRQRAVIVSGIGRSGTGYVAEVLRRAGLVATHEHVFRGGWSKPCCRCLLPIDVEVSGFAMPHLQEPGFRHHPVVLVVRHPLDWLRSWMRMRYSARYLQRHLGGRFAARRDVEFVDLVDLGATPRSHAVHCANKGERIQRSMALALEAWVRWTSHVAARAGIFFRVEDMTVDVVRAIGQLADASERCHDPLRALAQVPRDFHSVGGPKLAPLRWYHLAASPWREKAQALAARYGYPDRP